MSWYHRYLSIRGLSISEISPEIIAQIRLQLSRQQAAQPVVSVVVIAHNEERRLASCLWSLSELQSSYPMEILGVNNHSTDATETIYQTLGLPYYNEPQQSPGHARKCGLEHARGKYHFFIDADTFYPPRYIELMMTRLIRSDVACVGAFWSFYPDAQHSRLGLFLFELARDAFLFIQHFKRPELCIRGMTFAFRADYARQVSIRTDIRRGEDGSLALALKPFGRIAFLYHRQARPVTGYGTLGEGSLLTSFWHRVKVQMRGIGRIFYSKEHYEDSADNLLK